MVPPSKQRRPEASSLSRFARHHTHTHTSKTHLTYFHDAPRHAIADNTKYPSAGSSQAEPSSRVPRKTDSLGVGITGNSLSRGQIRLTRPTKRYTPRNISREVANWCSWLPSGVRGMERGETGLAMICQPECPPLIKKSNFSASARGTKWRTRQREERERERERER